MRHRSSPFPVIFYNNIVTVRYLIKKYLLLLLNSDYIGKLAIRDASVTGFYALDTILLVLDR